MTKTADPEHPIQELLTRRWSNRAFDPAPLEAGALDALLEAARWAPSCFNEQPWRFLVTERGGAGHASLLACLAEKNQQWAKDAPVLALTVARTTFTRNDKPNRHAWHDVGQAIMSLTVEATARGIGVHQMAGFDVDRARETFGIPDGFDPVAAVAIGRRGDPDKLEAGQAESERAPRTRAPQSDWVFRGAWRGA